MLESIYRSAGLRVGLFTSPHLISFRERIQVNRQLISEGDVARLVKATAKHVQGTETTFFEFVTVMALQYFFEQKCDLVIWETGLGGRLDATNIVTPLASVITNIGLDHQQWLGDTLAKIAAEKAGIIKQGVPVVTATTDPDARAVIAETASQLMAPLHVVGSEQVASVTRTTSVSLAGEHQRLNAALATKVVNVLQNAIPVNEAAICQGLAAVNWPGRLQFIVRANGQRILLDGAHNTAGAEVLRVALENDALFHDFKPSTATLILGAMSDKDWRTMCTLLAPLACRILVVPVASERGATPDELAVACRKANPDAEVSVCGGIVQALAQTDDDKSVVITGSLYLVGEALAVLDRAGMQTVDEIGLNNWQGSKPAA